MMEKSKSVFENVKFPIMTVLHKPSINNNYKSSCWGSSFKIYFLFGKLSNVEACFLSLFIFLLLVFSNKAGGKYIFENQGDEKGGASGQSL